MRKFLERCGCLKPKRPGRRFVLIGHHDWRGSIDDDQDEAFTYPDNRVVSSRYTIITFFPRNLFEQFQRIANFYFLCVAIIQLFTGTAVSPATSILPLLVVIGVSMIKQGYEDYLRHKADNEVNNQVVKVVRNSALVELRACEIQVGDVVYVTADETFPCDLVLLSSSEPSGECYVTTASLDGETNLKTFSSLADTKIFNSPETIDCSLRARVVCEQPQDNLYKFNGRLNIGTSGRGDIEAQRPLSAVNLLLRGARLKNTEFVFGCAIYTGPDTKMALNSKEKMSKTSRVERRLNHFLVVYFILLLLEGMVSTGCLYLYDFAKSDIMAAWYLPKAVMTAWSVIRDFFGFIILYNYLIPISLYVTIEMQKFFGSMFFEWDLRMYDAEGDHPAHANTSDLNEELGQIEYLFSDKTGTLTENDMQFRQCCVDGIFYLDDPEHGLCEKVGEEAKPLGACPPALADFFLTLCLCHTVRVERRESPGDNPAFRPDPDMPGSEYEYLAASPDEKAFVEAARRFGFLYHGNEGAVLVVTVAGRKLSYDVLYVLEFDSDRKCMSVILRNQADGSYKVLCKGAESSMLSKSVAPSQDDFILYGVNEYALQGLRTLVIAEREISPAQFAHFSKLIDTANATLEDRERHLRAAYNEVECELRLMGCTGIEDRLQDGVKETITDLRKAGIQVWILTGDKEETAVNISYSAGHFAPHMQEIRLTQKADTAECLRALSEQRFRVKESRRLSQGTSEFALVVDGTSLAFMIGPDLRDQLLALCLQCSTVLCCRMTPLQKAMVVGMIKYGVRPEPVTAAIGDGANDVSMIQEAHLGIGLYGKEGRQAVRASDYALGRFRFLRPALFLHGHYYYARIATLVQYFFYKNLAFVTAEFWFAIFSAFSAQTLYDSFFLMFYNLTLTALPVLIFGLFEQHIDRDLLLRKPELYRRITRNADLSWSNFAMWNLSALWHTLVSYFGVQLLLMDGGEVMGADGKTGDVFSMGLITVIIVFIIVTLKLFLWSRYFTYATLIGLVITLVGNLLLLVIYTSVAWPGLILAETRMLWIFYSVFAYPSVWLIMALLVATALLPDLIARAALNQIAQEDRPRRECKTARIIEETRL